MGTEGDSFFVVFTSAHQALLAGVEGQRRLQAHSWPDDVPIRVRMGIHTGEPQRHDDGYIGIDVHRAARIAATANGGQIVLSEATRTLVAELHDGLTERDLGRHRLKDLEELEHLYDVVAPGLETSFSPLRSLGTPANLPSGATSLIGLMFGYRVSDGVHPDRLRPGSDRGILGVLVGPRHRRPRRADHPAAVAFKGW